MAGGNHFQMRSKISVRTKPFLQGVQCLESWLTMQSAANQSPAANSLLTGKLTGNFAEPGHLSQFSYPIDARIQWLTAEFPTQPNREFLKCISGNLFRETGKSSQATAKPLTCAVRTPCVHHRADANAFR